MAGRAKAIAAAIACVATMASGTAMANPMSKAEKLRRLDIMLMVTGLRCRAGTDNFQEDFASFEARHMDELNRAAQDLRRETAGPAGAADERALDKISTAMANAYGGGHPWLGCHELKGLAHQLADSAGEESLIAAADETLQGDVPAPTVLAATTVAAPTVLVATTAMPAPAVLAATTVTLPMVLAATTVMPVPPLLAAPTVLATR